MDASPVNWKSAQVNASGLDVLLLGCVDFDAYLMLQDRLAVELQARSDRYGVLILCEHPPLFSLGRDGSAAELSSDPDDLEFQRLPVRWVGRGGGTWWHGPGQLSVSVLAPIERLGFSPCEFRQKLIQSVIETAQELHVPAQNAPHIPGVQGRVGQFAFVGASIQSGISQFGMIVNVAPDWDVTSFSPHGVRSSSIAAERLRPIAMATVRESLTRHLAAGLNYEETYIRTGHPWLRRTRQTVPIHA
jgi:lipoyl(octanoyl) transferase